MKSKTITKNVQVMLRVRPFLHGEPPGATSMHPVFSENSKRSITVAMPKHLPTDKQKEDVDTDSYPFDHVFWSIPNTPNIPCAGQLDVYEFVGKPSVDNMFQGYNSSIFAYGQTGSGKTYTMMGYGAHEQEGLTPNIVKSVFSRVSKENKGRVIKFSFMEVYMEKIRDLLAPEKVGPGPGAWNLEVKLIGKKAVVPKLKTKEVQSWNEVDRLMKEGYERRHTASTAMNETSSRSHAIVTLYLCTNSAEELSKCPKINIIDLAGSERVKKSKVEGEHLQEAASINLSLTNLGLVIEALSTKKAHVPIRDSTLTKLLSESLGGNSVTIMLACASPALSNFDETQNTLNYAVRARKITNKVTSARVAYILEEAEQQTSELEQLREAQRALAEREADKQALAEYEAKIEETERTLREAEEHLEEERKQAEEQEEQWQQQLHEVEAQHDREKAAHQKSSKLRVAVLLRHAAMAAQHAEVKEEKKNLEGKVDQLQKAMEKRQGEQLEQEKKAQAAAEEVEKARQEYEQLQAQQAASRAQYQAQLSAANQEKKKFERRLSDFEMDKKMLEDSMKEKADDVDQQKAELNKLKDEQRQLKDKIRELQTQLDTKDLESNLAKSENERITQENEELRDEVRAAQSSPSQAIESVKQRSEELEEQLNKAIGENDNLYGRISELQNTNTRLKMDRDTFEQRLKRFEDDNSKLQQENRKQNMELQRRIVELEAQLNGKSDELRKLQQQRASEARMVEEDSGSGLYELEARMRELQNELFAKKKQLTEEKQEKEDAIAVMNAQMEEVRTKCHGLLVGKEEKIIELEGAVNRHKQGRNRAETQVASLQLDKNELNLTVRDLEDQLNNVEGSKQKRDSDIHTKAIQLENLEKEIELLRFDKKELEQRLQGALEHNKSLDHTLSAAKRENAEHERVLRERGLRGTSPILFGSNNLLAVNHNTAPDPIDTQALMDRHTPSPELEKASPVLIAPPPRNTSPTPAGVDVDIIKRKAEEREIELHKGYEKMVKDVQDAAHSRELVVREEFNAKLRLIETRMKALQLDEGLEANKAGQLEQTIEEVFRPSNGKPEGGTTSTSTNTYPTTKFLPNNNPKTTSTAVVTGGGGTAAPSSPLNMAPPPMDSQGNGDTSATSAFGAMERHYGLTRDTKNIQQRQTVPINAELMGTSGGVGHTSSNNGGRPIELNNITANVNNGLTTTSTSSSVGLAPTTSMVGAYRGPSPLPTLRHPSPRGVYHQNLAVGYTGTGRISPSPYNFSTSPTAGGTYGVSGVTAAAAAAVSNRMSPVQTREKSFNIVQEQYIHTLDIKTTTPSLGGGNPGVRGGRPLSPNPNPLLWK